MELETAVERLYTDESIAADVDDKTAQPLLSWAESLLPALVARGDDGFDEAFVTLKKLVKSVARLIDLRGELDVAERAERAEKIQAFAQELGVNVNIDHLESLTNVDGPELVAQIVGGTTATAVDPVSVSPAVVSAAANDEAACDAPAGDQTALLPERVADTAAEPQNTEISENTDNPEVNHEIHPENAVDATSPEPSLLDGIGAFFQRFAGRLDNNREADHPEDKE